MKQIKHILFVVLALSYGNLFSQSNPENKLSLVFAGDIMGHDSHILSALQPDNSSYNFDTCFSLVKDYISAADIAVGNLEVTLGGPPYKGYPQFSSPDALAESLKKSGFDLMITANNHSLDRGKKGLERTIEVLQKKGLLHTGTFRNDSVRARTYPLILEKNGIRLAILNYTYGTNGLKVQEPNIVNYIDLVKIKSDLDKAKIAEPDMIVATIHWGKEYQREEDRTQFEVAEYMIEHGADVIVGSHPHVVQPIREIRTKNRSGLVVYSLGNFISNQRKRYTDGGILFELNLIKDSNNEETRVESYSYLPVWVHKPPRKEGGNHFVIVPAGRDRLWYEGLSMESAEYEKMKLFYDDTSVHLEGIAKTRLPVYEEEITLR